MRQIYRSKKRKQSYPYIVLKHQFLVWDLPQHELEFLLLFVSPVSKELTYHLVTTLINLYFTNTIVSVVCMYVNIRYLVTDGTYHLPIDVV